MQVNERAGTAAPVAWLVATAAALATLAATIFLLHPATTHAAPASGAAVSSSSTKLGRILVNSRGHTLYLFEKDRHGKSACTGQCATFWPPLITSGTPHAASGAKASLIGTTKRRRALAGDVQPPPAVHVQSGHQARPDERRGHDCVRGRVVRGVACRSQGRTRTDAGERDLRGRRGAPLCDARQRASVVGHAAGRMIASDRFEISGSVALRADPTIKRWPSRP
jgi:predicted lipoprotein with Yx(FWY)xxD motif